MVGIRISVGNATNLDGTIVPSYATPGSITASIGGILEASASGTTLSVSAVLSGSLQAGDNVSGSDGTNAILPGTTIIEQLSGSAGGSGTYQLSQATASGMLGICEITSASTVLNASAVGQGVLQAGQTLADLTGALLPGTLITDLLAVAAGGPGLYTISQQQTVASETMTLSMTLLVQIQPLAANELRHMDMLNLQGSHRKIYVSAPIRGAARANIKGGDLVILPDGSIWLVTQPLESFYSTAGFNAFAITLQDGS